MPRSRPIAIPWRRRASPRGPYREDAGISIDAIIRTGNLLILSARPGDESVQCGGLIARCCRQGRPPQIIVVTDGQAAGREPGVRAAMSHLGLPEDRLFLAAQSGSLPEGGPAFEAIVREIGLVMWRHDCTVICAPGLCAPGQDSLLGKHRAAFRIAAEVAARSGVGLISYGGAAPAVQEQPLRLDVTPDLARKSRAIEAYGLPAQATALSPTEIFRRHR